jgi:hypothetical protein
VHVLSGNLARVAAAAAARLVAAASFAAARARACRLGG